MKSQTPSNRGSENHWWIHQSRGCENYVREVIHLFSPYFCLHNRYIGVYPAPDRTEIEWPVSESPLQTCRNIIRACSNSLQRRIHTCFTTFVLYKSAHSVETFAWRLFPFLSAPSYSIRQGQPAAPACLGEACQSEDASLSEGGPASTKPSL